MSKFSDNSIYRKLNCYTLNLHKHTLIRWMTTIQFNGTGLYFFVAIAFGIEVLFLFTNLTKRQFVEKHCVCK